LPHPNIACRQKKQKYSIARKTTAKGTVAVHSSMDSFFTFFGHGLLVFLIRDFVEYGEKIMPLILCAKQKVFVEDGEFFYRSS
jgi:hypothetical protein